MEKSNDLQVHSAMSYKDVGSFVRHIDFQDIRKAILLMCDTKKITQKQASKLLAEYIINEINVYR